MIDDVSLNNLAKDIGVKLDLVEQAKALIVFSHGAGADLNHEFISSFSQLLNQQRLSVLRFNFPYMDKRAQDGKRRPPDRMPKLIARYLEVLSAVDTKLPVFLVGKSMGSRVAATIASDLLHNELGEKMLSQLGQDIGITDIETLVGKVSGVVALGYPFHPITKPENTRLAPLQESSKPVLICQGQRDKLGSQEEVETYPLPASCRVEYFIDGDHDLKPRVKSGFNQQQHLDKAAVLISEFIDEHS